MLCTISKLFILRKILSIFLTGCVIKLMDDYLDQDIDVLEDEPNLFTILELGGLPYALLLLSLAFFLDLVTALSLFLASFALGMGGNLTAKMPSGLYGYQESFIVLLLGFMSLKINMLSSMLIIAVIQLWDDVKDYKRNKINKKNLAFLLGKVECSLLAVICFLLSFYLDSIKAVSSIISTYLITYIIRLILIKNEKATSETI
ncbi:conserved membrane protein of unknown function [Tepidanaerobacter acetatoxydans Re1]|uniref:Uncharacterized protein n=2 Tax=Tepidanaerobacter acetatoxydans TaxID=499229 RepID=F4LUE2_TEPAE|nr:hypothetical protein TepRe1_1326 [Tepidanaerobacter acetatoxydans Re1]CDI40689.1 conserved membrane protein of unknown function [Tepidanaerobacter acetatoxydans Re1]